MVAQTIEPIAGHRAPGRARFKNTQMNPPGRLRNQQQQARSSAPWGVGRELFLPRPIQVVFSEHPKDAFIIGTGTMNQGRKG